jgi:N-acetylglucosamine-6-phosphate deacetylase
MPIVPERLLLADATLLDPEAAAPARGSLLVEDGRIAARLPARAAGTDAVRRIALAGAALGPGLLDLHHHGELVLRPAHDAATATRAASASMVRHGVTGFLPTTVAWPAPELAERVGALAAALGDGSWPGAEPLGLHLEGPWIRSEAAGAQPEAGIRPCDPAELRALLDRAGGLVRMITFAPEVEGGAGLLAELGRRGIVGALGHTLATAAQIAAAAERGARHVTHLFNAMGPLHQRAPGVAASVLAEERLSCDVIADGAHVHPDWLRVAARVKGEQLLLITDRIERPETGGAEGAWPGGSALQSDGTAWRLPDGRLAASHLALHDAVRNCVAWRVMMTRHDALRAATLAPARRLGIEAERGTLRPGARADLVLWSEEGEALATWVGGRLVHRDPAAPSAIR